MAAVVINVAGTFDGKAIAQAQKALGKLGGTASKESKGFAGSIGKMSGALKGLAAGAAVGVLVHGLGRLATAAQESAKVSAITAQALKTTGASAWTSSAQIDALATSISNKTGIDDEQIQSASNMLLAFDQVKNSGEGQAAVFDRATAAAADLSVRGFGSIEGAAKVLGKALQNPTKGIAALYRAGVTFTDQQKAQIAALQKSGDMLGAQAIIMGEVEKTVGGAAEAAADPIGMLKTQLGNLAEEAGKGLLPALKSIAQSLAPLFQQLQPVLAQLGGTLGNLITQIVTALTPAIGPLIQVVGVLVEALGGVLATTLPPLAAALASVAQALAPVITKVAKFAQAWVDSLMPALQPLLDALTPIIDALAAGLAPVLDVAIILVKALAPVVAMLATNLASILTAIAPLLPVFLNLLRLALTPTLALLEALTPVINTIVGALVGLGTWITTGLINVLAGALRWIANGLAGFFSDVLGRIPFIGDTFREAGDAIQGFATSLTGALATPGSTAATNAKDAGTTLGKSFSGAFGKTVEGGSKTIAEAAGKALKAALEAGQKALDKYQETARKFFDIQKEIRDSIYSSASDLKNALPTAGMVGPSAEGIIANLQEKLAQVRKFSGLLSQVSSLVAGTPGGNALIQQLIGAGPVDGAALAAALLEGGKSALSRIVGKKGGTGADAGLFAQIQSAASGVGTIGASSATGLTAGQARAINQTEVKVEAGAVVVNFGAGISGADRAAISRTVNTAVTKALAAAKAEAGRGK